MNVNSDLAENTNTITNAESETLTLEKCNESVGQEDESSSTMIITSESELESGRTSENKAVEEAAASDANTQENPEQPNTSVADETPKIITDQASSKDSNMKNSRRNSRLRYVDVTAKLDIRHNPSHRSFYGSQNMRYVEARLPPPPLPQLSSAQQRQDGRLNATQFNCINPPPFGKMDSIRNFGSVYNGVRMGAAILNGGFISQSKYAPPPQTFVAQNAPRKPYNNSRTWQSRSVTDTVPFNASASPSGANEVSKTNVYIRGIPASATDKTLRELCERYGKISTSKAVIDRETKQCKGFGFVDFDSHASALQCICDLPSSSGYLAQFAKQQQQDPTNLYLANIPLDISERELATFLRPYGIVISSRVLNENGVSKGVGFARMDSHEVCDKVIKDLNGKKAFSQGDRPLIVKYADTSKKTKQKSLVASSDQLSREPQFMYMQSSEIYPNYYRSNTSGGVQYFTVPFYMPNSNPYSPVLPTNYSNDMTMGNMSAQFQGISLQSIPCEMGGMSHYMSVNQSNATGALPVPINSHHLQPYSIQDTNAPRYTGSTAYTFVPASECSQEAYTGTMYTNQRPSLLHTQPVGVCNSQCLLQAPAVVAASDQNQNQMVQYAMNHHVNFIPSYVSSGIASQTGTPDRTTPRNNE